MENPATWGEAEKIVAAVYKDWWEGHFENPPKIGLSLPRRITDALRAAGLFQPEKLDGGIYVTPTTYAVSVLPEDNDHWNVNDRRYWSLYVKRSSEWQGEDKWFVTDGHYMLTRKGTWLSRYSEGFAMNRRHCYFATADEAIALARSAAPGVTVNGHPATEVRDKTEAYRATGKGWEERQRGNAASARADT